MPSTTTYTITAPSVTGPSSRTITMFTSQRMNINVLVKDYDNADIDGYNEAGADTIITLVVGVGDVTANFPVGTPIYVLSTTGGGYAGKAKVKTIAYTASKTVITLTTLLGLGTAGPSSGDYIYLPFFPQRFFSYTVLDGITTIVNSLYFAPESSGNSDINVGPACGEYLRRNFDTSLQPDRNQDGVNLSFSVKASDVAGTTTLGGSLSYFIVDGTRPTRQFYGDGLADFFVIESGANSGGRHLDKFFARRATNSGGYSNYVFGLGRVWRGKGTSTFWPCKAFYFIDPDHPTFTTLYMESNELAEDGSFIRANSSTSLATSTGPQLHAFTVDGTANTDQYYIETVISGSTTRANQIRRCLWEVYEEPEHPVQIYWRNSVGTLSFWVFGYNRSVTQEFKNGESISKYINTAVDLSIGELETLGNTSFQETITLRESSLNIVQANAVKEILTSNEVYLHLGGFSWENAIKVIPVTKSWSYESMTLYNKRRYLTYGGSPAYADPSPAVNTGSIEISFKLPINTSLDDVKGLDAYAGDTILS